MKVKMIGDTGNPQELDCSKAPFGTLFSEIRAYIESVGNNVIHHGPILRNYDGLVSLVDPEQTWEAKYFAGIAYPPGTKFEIEQE